MHLLAMNAGTRLKYDHFAWFACPLPTFGHILAFSFQLYIQPKFEFYPKSNCEP